MTLQTIIDTLKAIGLTQPNVRTATEGDIYRALDGNPSVKYGVFHLSQTTHHERENTDVYGFNLFYVDRLEDDTANRTQIQSIGKSVIGNIVSTFCDRMDGEHSEITYTPFTERFTDECAGVYATLTFEVMKEWGCPEYYEEGWVTPQVVIRNQVKTIQVTESGVYTVTPDEGYTGLEKVIVDAEMADTVQKRKNFTADRNKSVWVVYPDEPYLSIGSLQVDVDIPMQEKELEITSNGDYTVNADGNYGGLEEVNVKVDIPIQDRKEVRVTDPGLTVITADEGYEGVKQVDVTFEYEPKRVIPNGITLQQSTFTEFDMGQHDWSLVYDWDSMFANCFNLTEVKNWPAEIKPLNCRNMFFNCPSLVTAPMFNTSECVNMNGMFHSSRVLESVPYYNTSKVKNFENMFRDCNKLSSTSEFDLSSATTTKQMFSSCNKLTYIQFRGNPVNLTDTKDMFRYITSTGRMFYPAEYAENYQIIIDRLPATWTAIAY